VRENAYFLKTINDARTLRTRVGSLFEAASLPSTSEEERQRLLSFVVVGGGPTGVEFAGTLADYVRVDLARKFPSLRPTVTLLQSDKAILGAFSTSLQERALATLRSEGIDVKLGVRVMVRRELFFFFFFFFFLWFRRTRGPDGRRAGHAGRHDRHDGWQALRAHRRDQGANYTLFLSPLSRLFLPLRDGRKKKKQEVTDSEVIYRDKTDPSNAERRLGAGMVLWSAGNSSRPLVRDLVTRFPAQVPYSKKNPVVAKIAVDPWLRVIGAKDALAIGDCSVMTGRRLPATAQVAGQQGAFVARLLNRGYRVGRGGVAAVVGGSGVPPPPPMAPGVHDLAKSWSAAVRQSMDSPSAFAPSNDSEGEGEGPGGGGGEKASPRRSSSSSSSSSAGTRAGRAVAASLWLPQLLGGEARGDSEALLRDARKEAGFSSVDGGEGSTARSVAPPPRPFEFLSLGILAYVGSDKGVSDVAVPGLGETVKVSGYLSFLLWRSVYLTKQVSTRNRVLILLNWTMTRIFGRDLSLF